MARLELEGKAGLELECVQEQAEAERKDNEAERKDNMRLATPRHRAAVHAGACRAVQARVVAPLLVPQDYN